MYWLEYFWFNVLIHMNVIFFMKHMDIIGYIIF